MEPMGKMEPKVQKVHVVQQVHQARPDQKHHPLIGTETEYRMLMITVLLLVILPPSQVLPR
jgi:hypothetical protein